MKKITTILLLALTTVYGYAQTNLISNGTFDDATGWTLINHDITSNTGTSVIGGGVVTFDETATDPWKHLGVYTTVTLEAEKTYEVDLDIAFDGIVNAWAEVWIGKAVPVAGEDYNGDNGAVQIMKAFHFWECGSLLTYSGLASLSGCAANPSQWTVPAGEGGTYYVVFRTGGETYGTTGVVVDNMTLYDTAALSVDDFKTNVFAVYPNPTNNVWTVSSKNQTINSIEVYNVLGKKVISSQPNTLSATIDASNLTSGIYFTNIKTVSGIVSKKLIKN